MHYSLYFLEGQFKTFNERLMELNRYIKYFPIPADKKTIELLPKDELVEIVDRAKLLQYQCALLQANYDPYLKTLAEYSQYIECLKASNLIGKTLKDLEEGGNKSRREGKRKRSK